MSCSDFLNPFPRFVLAILLKLRLCLLVLFAIPLLCGVARAQHTEVVLHSFASGVNGKQPLDSVTFDGSGNMYGTTYAGGASSRGTVWEITSAGVFSTLHSFTTSDGGFSQGGVTLDSSGNLFGTASGGGTHGVGTVWEITAGGNFSVFHNFSLSDGGYPLSTVVFDGSGTMYGTSEGDNATNSGTVWKIDSGGTFSVLYAFPTNANYPATPLGSVAIDASGNVYGTTSDDGAYHEGTAWKIDTAGNFTKLHDFGQGTDAFQCFGAVTFDSNGNLYGTSHYGGPPNDGALWKITSGGAYSVIHSFQGGADGSNPVAGVTFDSNGNMYGTTLASGANGFGTVWELTSGGTYSTLYSFRSGTDGNQSLGGVSLDSSGNLYGTTEFGGTSNVGTVWELGPPKPTLTGFSLSATSQTGGSGVVGTVKLGFAAYSGGYAVNLSSNSIYAAVPRAVTVPAGATSATFPIWTDPLLATKAVVITATDGANTFTSNLSLKPYTASVFTFQVYPTYVVGGTASTALVQLDHFVTTIGGEVVTLSSGNINGTTPTAAILPVSVNVPFGSNSVTFPITSYSVSSVTPVNLSAVDGGTQSGLVFVMPAGDFGVNLTVNPGGIYGGNTAVGTVSLSSVQPSDTIVNLSSNNSNATVPPTVTVPAGSTIAAFNVSTSPVLTATAATSGGWTWITASAGLSSQAVAVTVIPAVVHAIASSPSSVAGGGTSTGTVTLSSPAPTGGIMVTLSSASSDATIPSAATILAGNSTVTFPITAAIVPLQETFNLSATYAGKTVSSGFTIAGPPTTTLHSISSSPNSVVGGIGSTGTVTLSGPAPAGGATVMLTASGADLQVPVSTFVASGMSSGTFAITTSRVSISETVTVSATYLNQTVSTGFTIAGSVSLHSISSSPNAVVGGASSTGTVTISDVAPTGGTTIFLTSSSPDLQFSPTSVTIPAGSTSITFSISTSRVSVPEAVTMTATLGANSISTGFTIAGSVSLHSISSSPNAVVGGASSTGTVTISDVAPTGGTTIFLTSSSPDLQFSPTSVTIPAGSTSITFSITTSTVSSSEPVTMMATLGTHSITTGFTIAASIAVHSVMISPSSVTGGTSTTGTVTLTGNAPASGTVITLTSSDPCAQLLATVTVPGGQSSTTFPITTTPVVSNTSLSIYATLNSTTVNYGLLVAAPTFSGLTYVGSSAVTGGTSVIFSANLNGPAPTGGITIMLSSSNSAVGSVPTTVFIPAGSNSGSFTMTTTTVTTQTDVTITGTYGTTSHAQTLHVKT